MDLFEMLRYLTTPQFEVHKSLTLKGYNLNEIITAADKIQGTYTYYGSKYYVVIYYRTGVIEVFERLSKGKGFQVADSFQPSTLKESI